MLYAMENIEITSLPYQPKEPLKSLKKIHTFGSLWLRKKWLGGRIKTKTGPKSFFFVRDFQI